VYFSYTIYPVNDKFGKLYHTAETLYPISIGAVVVVIVW
jgi:hypothetical protein